jgi:hypothetical protein
MLKIQLLLVVSVLSGCSGGPSDSVHGSLDIHPFVSLLEKPKAQVIEDLIALGFTRKPTGLSYEVVPGDWKTNASIELVGDPVRRLRFWADKMDAKFPFPPETLVQVDSSNVSLLKGGSGVALLRSGSGSEVSLLKVPLSEDLLPTKRPTQLGADAVSSALAGDLKNARQRIGPITVLSPGSDFVDVRFGTGIPGIATMSGSFSSQSGKCQGINVVFPKGKKITVKEAARMTGIPLIAGKASKTDKGTTTAVTAKGMTGSLTHEFEQSSLYLKKL